MASVSRHVLKWLQSLDLRFHVSHPRNDLSNGYIVAEILAKYYETLDLRTFVNEHSLQCHQENWAMLSKFISRNGLNISLDLQMRTMHRYAGAASQLLEALFSCLTGLKYAKKPEDDLSFLFRHIVSSKKSYEKPTKAVLLHEVPQSEVMTVKDYETMRKKFQRIDKFISN